MRLRLLFSVVAVIIGSLAPRAASQASPPDIRRDATVLAIEAALPSVVNISTKTVRKQGGMFIGEKDSLVTKCPSKYETAETPT